MTLAVILSLWMFCSGPATAAIGAWTQASQQPPAEVKSADSPPSGQSADPQQSQPPGASNVKPPTDSAAEPPKQPTAAKRRRSSQAKKTAPCNASGNGKTPTAASPSDSAPGSAAAATSSPAPELPPCAPPKVVIRNGGTTDATVRLTGGSAPAKDSPQRANTNRLLGSTEEALKKIDGQHLDSSQQETVKQVHEYAAQSRAALEAGNLELAHNLALKAHLLVDQLVKPQP